MSGGVRPYLVTPLLVAVGMVVLLTLGAAPTLGWFSYGPAPSPELLDSLTAWTRTRAVGAGLVVLGVLVGAATTGVLVGRGRSGRP